jgi:hypothetical protein
MIGIAKQRNYMAKAKKPSAQEEALTIPRINIKLMEITVIGDTSLITNQWSEAAKEQIKGKQAKAAMGPREARNPKAEYEASLYKMPDGSFGFPAIAFKKAAVSACRYIDGLPMTKARGAFFVMGEMVQIKGQPNLREDMVRLQTGVSSIAYRADFARWSCKLTIRFNAGFITPEQIMNLFEVAGFHVGIGQWRPECDGTHGMFHVGRRGEKV